MCLIVEVVTPLSELPLGRLVEQHDFELELEPSIPTSADTSPFIWVRGPDARTFGTAADSAPDIDSLRLVETVPDGALYSVEWNFDRNPVFASLAERPIVLLECLSATDSWWLRFRIPSHGMLTALRRDWTERGLETEVDRITPLAADEEPASDGLTSHQLEALLLALERGYFDEHRRTSLDELGDELDISRQAVAARLRRAYRTLAERIRNESSYDERIT
ncbi:DNA-binding protein [Haloferax mediterranei ATCC 33500]|uniref:DNA binding domain-containing protein n=1 Tax=Haloferax mediterranei (strain ATCC 33500 / DSM 1411 / JCM 8866 / NBRC 14739 / NCIMB 2177 / R-4) TaxID=523841 RepID=I3R2J9_HALMT|nr:helix-turn-helix domain-containing protein [Haloferax mediterranei]AFK18459.1 DNA binding domain-containing protein [Haloferax mediterranei ATCC 33500]AHZ22155.1 DNA-binding protein [Haloferax mediterranei ATCC 33500]EMA02267.1 DNA binding domain-containing protein [Haloferax mediterranei ATCC 33500]MDX5988550.1 helix-turn-helix domain-containing protein [Haloferax mediterranei ATCC 33500]QCQ74964.1 DNA-binding protein [Haloferax mediterranei ATCC 33500]